MNIVKQIWGTKTKGLAGRFNRANQAYKLIAPLILISTISTMSYAHADTDEAVTIASKSVKVEYNGEATTLPQSQVDLSSNPAQQQAIISLSAINASPQTRKSREQIIQERKETIRHTDNQSKLSVPYTKQVYSYGYVEFDIYSATSNLFTDIDYDGFYQTFSVTFDADVYGHYTGQQALVFADLYLSKNGGPWELFYTTDNFVIEDDLSNDEFEVVTTLESGYRTNHYDVLIDLYEVGYQDIVATISSDDSNALYALPLESADRDTADVQSYSTSVYVNAGSSSVFGLVALMIVVIIRYKVTRVL